MSSDHRHPLISKSPLRLVGLKHHHRVILPLKICLDSSLFLDMQKKRKEETFRYHGNNMSGYKHATIFNEKESHEL